MISIIIPTYNRANLIERAIRNIFEQTYSDIELIVVDDGSTDETEKILSSIDDQRLKYVRYTPNKGANHARNVGMDNATGEYIAFQDSDDLWEKNKLKKQVEKLLEENADYCVCRMYTDDQAKTMLHRPNFCHVDMTLENELKRNFVSTQILIAKRDVFAVHRFDENFPRFQDWDIAIRIVKDFKGAFCDEILCTRYRQEVSISNRKGINLVGYRLLFQKYKELYGQHPTAKVEILRRIARATENADERIAWFEQAAKMNQSLTIRLEIFLSKIGLYDAVYNARKAMTNAK